VGCEVSDVRDGRVYGTITGWQDSGGPTVLEMSPVGGGEPVLVPFARSICQKIDVAARRIEIDPPAGLIELNAGPGEAAEESE
jgi:16S rRNA processing protein RimM